jgi:hypothetical protein
MDIMPDRSDIRQFVAGRDRSERAHMETFRLEALRNESNIVRFGKIGSYCNQ